MNIDERRKELRVRMASLGNNWGGYSDKEMRRNAQTSVRLSMGDLIQDDFTRRKVLGWLWGNGKELSTSHLTDVQLRVMKEWLKILPGAVEGEWTISLEATGELRQMAALVDGKLDNPVLPMIDEPGPMVQEAIKLGGQLKNDAKTKPFFTCD